MPFESYQIYMTNGLMLQDRVTRFLYRGILNIFIHVTVFDQWSYRLKYPSKNLYFHNVDVGNHLPINHI